MIHIRFPQSIAGLLSETAREGVVQTVETSGTASICYTAAQSFIQTTERNINFVNPEATYFLAPSHPYFAYRAKKHVRCFSRK
jgi:hypothetical protein